MTNDLKRRWRDQYRGPLQMTLGLRKMLEAAHEYHRDNGRPATVRELGSLCGLHSSSTAMDRLWRLREMGYLDWDDGQVRTMRLTPAAYALLGVTPPRPHVLPSEGGVLVAHLAQGEVAKVREYPADEGTQLTAYFNLAGQLVSLRIQGVRVVEGA